MRVDVLLGPWDEGRAYGRLGDDDEEDTDALLDEHCHGRGATENKHSTDVEPPPPPPRVCMSGGVLKTSTRPTLNLLHLLLRASV